MVIAYYVNHPEPEPLPDTWSYPYVVDRFQMHGQLVNFWRLPGYPLFIVLVYTLLGEGNLGAVSLAQAILFVMAMLEIYILCILVLRRTWIALLVGLFFITIENRGDDAGPSTMTITYKTASPRMPRVRLQVKTPPIPAGNEFWLAVELPTMPGSGGIIKPVGLVTLTADATHALPEKHRADQTHLTYCKDGR